MWIASKFGFYSIVQTREDKNQFMVRARAEKDLKNLTSNISLLRNHQILRTENADYRFRILIIRVELETIMNYFATEIDYPNFKNKVKSIPDQKDKLPFYHDIWAVMHRFQS